MTKKVTVEYIPAKHGYAAEVESGTSFGCAIAKLGVPDTSPNPVVAIVGGELNIEFENKFNTMFSDGFQIFNVPITNTVTILGPNANAIGINGQRFFLPYVVDLFHIQRNARPCSNAGTRLLLV